MKANRRTEFINGDNGRVIVVHEERVSHLDDKENRDLIDELYERIEKEFPEAFKALANYYSKSRMNKWYFKYKLVKKFVMCNFGENDFKNWDIDEMNHLNFERVKCPCRGECPLENVVCSPIFASGLTRREEEIIKIVRRGGTAEMIAEKMGISVNTVRSHMNNIMSKLGKHNFIEVIDWWHENNSNER